MWPVELFVPTEPPTPPVPNEAFAKASFLTAVAASLLIPSVALLAIDSSFCHEALSDALMPDVHASLDELMSLLFAMRLANCCVPLAVCLDASAAH